MLAKSFWNVAVKLFPSAQKNADAELLDFHALLYVIVVDIVIDTMNSY